MISREEFAQAIRTFLGETSAICAAQTPNDLRHRLGFERELQEAKQAFRDPSSTSSVILMAAFGLVDEFVNRTWNEVIDKSYSFYVDQHRSMD